jgi:hypothetical protein
MRASADHNFPVLRTTKLARYVLPLVLEIGLPYRTLPQLDPTGAVQSKDR